jgi:hypothetical protein
MGKCNYAPVNVNLIFEWFVYMHKKNKWNMIALATIFHLFIYLG